MKPWRAGLLVGAALVVVELLAGQRLGLFRDELYYLACADRLDWGYVDHPPLSIALLWAWRGLFGDSQLALRGLPALVGAVRVALVARLARRLGGGAWAEWLAALLAAFAPAFLGSASVVSMNVLDGAFWAGALLLLVELVDGGSPRLWWALGLVIGLGLLNKWSVLFLLPGAVVGVLLSPARRGLLRWECWAGVAMAAALQLPHLVWQQRHGWPTLEFIHRASTLKNVALSPLEFAVGQVMELSPVLAPVWLAGLAWTFFGGRRRFQVLGWVYVCAFTIFAVQHGKAYYLSPAYAGVLAGAGVAVEQLRWAWARAAVLGLCVVGAVVAAPFAIPVLGPEGFVAYAAALGVRPAAAENTALGPLPQFFADRFGWEELTQRVAEASATLSPEERAVAVVVTENYGEAAALERYGRGRGLPRVLSQHNSYFFWAEPLPSFEVTIVVGQGAEGLAPVFRECRPLGRLESPWAMPYERAQPVRVCRGLLQAPAEVWRQGRHFI